ncbi:IclR family transcriptional regulator [Streptomyces sp. PRKS01-29]|nr:IclR family transcriptional regulator [Streptomyces sabulosicollis]MBI0294931.1 IclR family transcriptional regulator [Streptomyces sabulosicollis]
MAQDGGLALVRKSVELLDLLAARGEATAAQLAEELGEPRSSVYRLLSSLQGLDMVEGGSRRGTFRLGFHLLSLGTAVVERFDERRFAQPVMERLHDETGETVYLCVRRGREAVCIERLDGRRVQSLALKLGGALPLHAGAASRVLLAFQDRSTWADYLEQGPLERFTPSTPATADALVPVLEQTRDSGISVSDQDVTVGVAALGVPILDYRGQVRAALSISGVREAILGAEVTGLRERLTEAGQEVSRALGWQAVTGPVADFG